MRLNVKVDPQAVTLVGIALAIVSLVASAYVPDADVSKALFGLGTGVVGWLGFQRLVDRKSGP